MQKNQNVAMKKITSCLKLGWTRLKNIISLFGTKNILYGTYWKYLYLRIFVHRNVWYTSRELRTKKNRRDRLHKKKMYGISQPLKKKFGWKLVKRDGSRCAHCKRHLDIKSPDFTVDHKKPVSKGGQTVLENLQILCKPCNGAKGNREFTPASNEPGRYPSIKEAFERAGITKENMPHLFAPPAQESKTFSRKTVSRVTTHQSRS